MNNESEREKQQQERRDRFIKEAGLAGAWLVSMIELARELTQKELAQRALVHEHDNVLAQFVKRDVYQFGIKSGILRRCECGLTLVMKTRWANGEKIKVKSNREVSKEE